MSLTPRDKENHWKNGVPVGRPPLPIDWKKLEEFLVIGCTEVECAAYFNMRPHTLNIHIEKKTGKTFTDYRYELQEKGKIPLRKIQYEKALKGNIHMLIWLGKNRLNQRDKPIEEEFTPEAMAQFNAMMDMITKMQKDQKKKAKKDSEEEPDTQEETTEECGELTS